MSKPYREVFSVRVAAGSCTLFVDVKRMEDGSHFVSLAEVSRRENEPERRSHILFAAEYIDALQGALSGAFDYIAGATGAPAYRVTGAGKGTLAEIRKAYPRAYDRWAPEEDEALRRAYVKGQGIGELAQDFGRNEGAIRARLLKLGLANS